MWTHIIEAYTEKAEEKDTERSASFDLARCVLCPSRSSRQEVDRADGGGAEGVCDEAAGCTGGDGQGQEAEGGPGHPLPSSGCVGLVHHNQL